MIYIIIFYFKKFIHSSSAAILPMIAVMFTTLLMSAGIGLDSSRAYLIKEKINHALDNAGAAALATADMTNEAEVIKIATEHFEANFNFSNVTLENFNVEVLYESTILLSTDFVMPNSLTSFFKKETRGSVFSEVTNTGHSNVEVAVAIDSSASISGSFHAVKNATKLFVNILYGNQQLKDGVNVGIIPFSGGVNIGTGRPSWMNNSRPWTGSLNWRGCVEARPNMFLPLDRLDTPPTDPSTQFFAYQFPEDGTRLQNNDGTLSPAEQIADQGHIQSQPSATPLTPLAQTTGAGKGPNSYCQGEIIPFLVPKDEIFARLDIYEADSIATVVTQGMVWAWRLLSPKWNGFWGGEMDSNNLPSADPDVKKIAIMLSDGENTFHQTYTAYRRNDSQLAALNNDPNLDLLLKQTPNEADLSDDVAVARMDERFSEICETMKLENITIYTVLFRSEDSVLFENCASEDGGYYKATSENELIETFEEIAKDISAIRVAR